MKISDAIRVAPSNHPRYNTPPRVDGSCLVIGDAQVPFQDADFIDKCKSVALAYGVKSMVWVGDMIDLHAISIFLAQAKDALADELLEDEIGLKSIAAGFDQILWLCGNHDERLSRVLQMWVPMERIAAMLGLDARIEASNYYHCFIGDKWLASHPKNSSVIPARIPSTLALKYRRNVLSFHGHLVGAVQINDYWAIDVGVTCDPERLEYSMVRQSTRPKVQRGAVLMLKGADDAYHPRLLNDLTNWELEVKTGGIWQRENRNRVRSQITSTQQSNQSATTPTRKRRMKSSKRARRAG